MPRIGSIAGRSLANVSTIRKLIAVAFTGPNISASATKLQLGGGTRIANSSTWSFSNTTVSFSGTGLPYHSYGNSLAVNIPADQKYKYTWKYRGGTNVEGTRDYTVGGGLIGLWLNGVGMFNPSAQFGAPPGFIKPQGFEFNAAYEAGLQIGYSFGEDLAGGHAAPPNQYHYHDGSFFTAWETGTGHAGGTYGSTGLAECSVIEYLKSGLTHVDGHSKILGISADGYPIYGPFGYNIATDSSSPVVRMDTGYTLSSEESRVGTSADNLISYPMGIFIEDYVFTASGDLDEHNGRYCVTPDYPQGTYAYFLTVNSEMAPVYPYVIGNTFYGSPARLT